jgi:hypothetical protein
LNLILWIKEGEPAVRRSLRIFAFNVFLVIAANSFLLEKAKSDKEYLFKIETLVLAIFACSLYGMWEIERGKEENSSKWFTLFLLLAPIVVVLGVIFLLNPQS